MKNEPDPPVIKIKDYLTSFPEENPKESIERYTNVHGDLNLKATWGVMGSGGGYATLCEILGVLGVQGMSQNLFLKTQLSVGKVWMDTLTDVLLENGKESLQRAIHEDRYVDDTYWTKVVCDGGWNKRSKGHDYTAKGCVAVIIDAYTKKLLYVGIKNKYCYVCFRAKKEVKTPLQHLCFMNYDGPSKSMETDILIEGFRVSDEMHGLQCRRFIGDGDSSVLYKLKQNISYGPLIEKEECANHVTKNYTSYLYNLVKMKKGAHAKFLKREIIQRLTKYLRGAIKKNAEEECTADNLKSLLQKGPDHVFGNHVKCNDTCPQKSQLPNGFIEDRWYNLPAQVLQDVRDGVENVCKKADFLLTDVTTNLAENYMSVAAKFCGGKQISRSKRGSYHARIGGASLSYALGPKWHAYTWKKTFNHSPTNIMKKFCSKTANHRAKSKRNLIRYYSNIGGRFQAKRKCNQQLSLGNSDYGPSCNRPDMKEEELKIAMVTFEESYLKSSDTALKELDERTKGQSSNENWIYERSNRITSTYFHRIATRKQSTKTAPIVKDIRSGGCGYRSTAMLKDSRLEPIALRAYEEKIGAEITKGEDIGLLVHSTHQFLGTSLDGILPDGTPIEVKTVHNIPENKTIIDAARTKGLVKDFFLQSIGLDIKLKATHKYYSQIQGQLEISNQEKCCLLVYNNEKDWEVLTIERNREHWARVFPSLLSFWKESLLPEIVDSRLLRNLEPREPISIGTAMKTLGYNSGKRQILNPNNTNHKNREKKN